MLAIKIRLNILFLSLIYRNDVEIGVYICKSIVREEPGVCKQNHTRKSWTFMTTWTRWRQATQVVYPPQNGIYFISLQLFMFSADNRQSRAFWIPHRCFDLWTTIYQLSFLRQSTRSFGVAQQNTNRRLWRRIVIYLSNMSIQTTLDTVLDIQGIMLIRASAKAMGCIRPSSCELHCKGMKLYVWCIAWWIQFGNNQIIA